MEYSVSVSADAQVELSHWLLVPRKHTTTNRLDPRTSTVLDNAIDVTWCDIDPLCILEDGPGASEMVVRTQASGIGVACRVHHELSMSGNLPGTPVTTTTEHTINGVIFSASTRLRARSTMTMVALAAYATDGPLLTDEAQLVPDEELLDTTRRALAAVRRTNLIESQQSAMAEWWSTADIEVSAETDPDIQGAVRWNLFQTFQAVIRGGGLGIPAKGLTGSGYDGHTFWDAEAMVLPMLTFTHPALARPCLAYRHSLLPRARQRAAELHHRGALFPWRGIDGREASAFFEAGTAQYHINADIAYAVDRYMRLTADLDYLTSEGLDILVDTARFWADLGFFDARGRFHIHGVTGPDEYSALVDDNLYTNVMAATNLEAAHTWLLWLQLQDTAAGTRAYERLNVTRVEADSWMSAARAMTIPFDEELGIHGQDAHFLSHQKWDFDNTPAEMYPLLLHYHPLTIYRHQVLKQADTVLALINRPDLFPPEQMQTDFDYYDALTTGDSTLSISSQAIVAARVGHLDLAERYFRSSLAIDLDNTHGNTSDGVHIAAAASVWTTLVLGFAGCHDYAGFRLDPHLPDGWTRLAFHLCLHKSTVRVVVTPTGVDLTLEEGPSVSIQVYGNKVTLTDRTHIER